eukprot:1787229-Amphidinium_carterae.1
MQAAPVTPLPAMPSGHAPDSESRLLGSLTPIPYTSFTAASPDSESRLVGSLTPLPVTPPQAALPAEPMLLSGAQAAEFFQGGWKGCPQECRRTVQGYRLMAYYKKHFIIAIRQTEGGKHQVASSTVAATKTVPEAYRLAWKVMDDLSKGDILEGAALKRALQQALHY